jgi:hypothetical protein
MNNSLISVIIGIVLIILWIPSSFISEINNKKNRQESKLLKSNIGDLITNSTLTLESMTESVSPNITAKLLTQIKKNIKDQGYNNLETLQNYYITYDVKTENNGKFISSDINSIIKKYEHLTDENYKYLATKNKIFEKNWNSETTEGDIKIKTTYDLKIYSIPEGTDLHVMNGLLGSGDREQKNKYGIPIYKYEIGSIDEIRAIILERKSSSNFMERWGGRLLVFLVLFIGLALLIAPIESLKDLLSDYFPILAGLIQVIINLYNTLSFGISIILTIVLTLIVYILVNYTLWSVSALLLIISAYMIGPSLLQKK